MKRVQIKKYHSERIGSDLQFQWLTKIDPEMEQWRVLVADWISKKVRGTRNAMTAMRHFCRSYILDLNLEKVPEKFLRSDYSVPDFVPILKKGGVSAVKSLALHHGYAVEFIDYVLQNYYSAEDDFGRPVVSPGYRNPIPPHKLDGFKPTRDESDKSVLPYKYISALRHIICPKEARHFSEWEWSHAAGDSVRVKPDWFAVSPKIIDRTDPDCVWRERETSAYEREKWGWSGTVFEMWSPVCAVALLIKLYLPLRTFQVRMLDSGEADTMRYVSGNWVKNQGRLSKGSVKSPCRRGVFRQMIDNVRQSSMTGLYINSNKTADRKKDEWTRGYTLPWEHADVLYWLEKLRNWQEKYNPLDRLTPWSDLTAKHTGNLKHDKILEQMGDTAFLFRDAASKSNEEDKPISGDRVDVLWSKLLKKLEVQCTKNGDLDLAGQPLRFHTGTSTVTFYPLHSLRVSLITAYALEGGVPMQILSKCIAGHARLIMTLYYTKAGITYCTEVMEEATKRLLEKEQESMIHWLKDKTYEQLQANGAFFDPAAVQALMQAMQSGGAPLVKDDKGLCTKSGFGCDSGGTYTNEDTLRVTYGEVPGYPQKNCVRCRWFFTGPAFIDGLHNHWNNIQYSMGETGERIIQLEDEIGQLEDQQYDCAENDTPFVNRGMLDTLRKVYQTEIEKNNKHAEDSQATYRLISRCRILMEEGAQMEGVRLVAVGALPDVRIAIEECSKMQQVLASVAGSAIYPEHDVSKAVLQAGKAFDMMLKQNGREPVFFTLNDDEQKRVAQHMTRLLAATAGSIKNAVPFVVGSQRLSEIGLDLNMQELANEMASSRIVKINSQAPDPFTNTSVRALYLAPALVDKEAVDATE